MNDQRTTTLVSLIMMVATATLGWITLKDGSGLRVGDNRPISNQPADEQDVTARLWEDPLQAVLSAPKQGSGSTPPAAAKPTEMSERHTLEGLRAAVETQLQASPSRKVCLLVLPIPDTPYPDDAETRLRLRYSVQMALADRRYLPDNRSYLGFVRLGPEELAFEKSVAGAVVPYEWFLPRKIQHAGGRAIDDLAVLVLWMPESRIAKRPLWVLADLVRRLIRHPERFNGVFMIGPQSSDTLKTVVSEAQGSSTCEYLGALSNRFAIYSAQATAPDAAVGIKAVTQWNHARSKLDELLRTQVGEPPVSPEDPDAWRYFRNFIATDDQLTDLLVAELKLRGMDPLNDKILLLTEADTAYGRSLPVALAASLRSLPILPKEPVKDRKLESGTSRKFEEMVAPDLAPGRKAPPSVDPPANLLIYRYLRGLDQQKGQTQTSASTRTPSAGAKNPDELLELALSKQGPMALGDSQLDYVDRLAQELGAGTKSRGEIKAVGVLGGDIYDKIILLRSLRRKFPEALFFTTDLDARLWHPDHLRFTRNVIVASTASARLVGNTASPARIPPFRDTYQATVFNACRAALDTASRNSGAPAIEPAFPALYEIGRNGPVELTSFASGTPPSRWPDWGSSGLTAFCFVLGGVLIALICYNSNYRRRSLSVSHFHWGVGSTVAIIIGFWLAACYELPTRGCTEPWSLSAGISVWPTEIMRLIITGIVLSALYHTWRRQAAFYEKLGEEHHFPPAEKSEEKFSPREFLKEAGTALREWWHAERAKWRLRFARRDWSLGVAAEPAANRYDAATEFSRYRQRMTWSRRAGRVVTATAVYLFTAFSFMFLVNGAMPLNTHIRGGEAHGIDFALLLISITAFLALVFYVLDAVLITARLLDRIKEPTDWPAPLLAARRELYGVRDEDLDGFSDVSFAAQLSANLGRLILLPFGVQFLFILSRNSYFDNWTWPGALITIFVCNFVLACVAWGVLRRAARAIRIKALAEIDHSAHLAARDEGKEAKFRAAGLQRMRKEVEDENRGAYARFFQDPALLAMVLPSGVFGIALIVFRVLFSGF